MGILNFAAICGFTEIFLKSISQCMFLDDNITDYWR